MSKNTSAMHLKQKELTDHKIREVLSVIKQMVKNGEPVSILGAAKKAKVTRPFIYAHEILMIEINKNRTSSVSTELSRAKKMHEKRSASYMSLEAKYLTLLTRNKTLMLELSNLQSQLSILHAHIEAVEAKNEKITLLSNNK